MMTERSWSLGFSGGGLRSTSASAIFTLAAMQTQMSKDSSSSPCLFENFSRVCGISGGAWFLASFQNGIFKYIHSEMQIDDLLEILKVSTVISSPDSVGSSELLTRKISSYLPKFGERGSLTRSLVKPFAERLTTNFGSGAVTALNSETPLVEMQKYLRKVLWLEENEENQEDDDDFSMIPSRSSRNLPCCCKFRKDQNNEEQQQNSQEILVCCIASSSSSNSENNFETSSSNWIAFSLNPPHYCIRVDTSLLKLLSQEQAVAKQQQQQQQHSTSKNSKNINSIHNKNISSQIQSIFAPHQLVPLEQIPLSRLCAFCGNAFSCSATNLVDHMTDGHASSGLGTLLTYATSYLFSSSSAAAATTSSNQNINDHNNDDKNSAVNEPIFEGSCSIPGSSNIAVTFSSFAAASKQQPQEQIKLKDVHSSPLLGDSTVDKVKFSSSQKEEEVLFLRDAGLESNLAFLFLSSSDVAFVVDSGASGGEPGRQIKRAHHLGHIGRYEAVQVKNQKQEEKDQHHTENENDNDNTSFSTNVNATAAAAAAAASSSQSEPTINNDNKKQFEEEQQENQQQENNNEMRLLDNKELSQLEQQKKQQHQQQTKTVVHEEEEQTPKWQIFLKEHESDNGPSVIVYIMGINHEETMEVKNVAIRISELKRRYENLKKELRIIVDWLIERGF